MSRADEPLFCADCGRRLRERRSNVSDTIFVTCPKNWQFSILSWIFDRERHTDFLTDRRVKPSFDPKTGEFLG